MAKFLLIATDGYEIESTEYATFKDAKNAMSIAYHNLCPKEFIEDCKAASFLGYDNAVLFCNGENVYLWNIRKTDDSSVDFLWEVKCQWTTPDDGPTCDTGIYSTYEKAKEKFDELKSNEISECWNGCEYEIESDEEDFFCVFEPGNYRSHHTVLCLSCKNIDPLGLN